jgi:5-methylcytosine-specific restriction endonuclease McrA
MNLISRKEALASGSAKYFTGKPCKRGHISERFVASSNCVACKPVHDAAYRSSEQGRKTGRKLTAKYRERHPDRVREAVRKRNQRPDVKRVHAEYEAKRRRLDVAAEKRKAYRQKPEVKRRHANYQNHVRRPKLNGAEGKFTKADIAFLLETQRGLCLCGTNIETTYTVDHIIPLSRGGTNWPDNIQLLCAECNSSKRNKLMSEWHGRIMVAHILDAKPTNKPTG